VKGLYVRATQKGNLCTNKTNKEVAFQT